MKGAIDFGSKRIAYLISFSPRKSLGITVTPDSEVLVKAPLNISKEKIEQVVRKKASWIIKQQGFFLSFQPRTPERRFVSGETHLYLGRQYRLKIISSAEEFVMLKGRFIEVYTADKTRAKDLMKNWYLQNAKRKFTEYANPIIERFRKYKVEPSSIVLREMPTRWGSCTPKNKIILNPELIKAPIGCIEYVITHELCHLIHSNHTQKFLDLQSKEMPGWEKWKFKLETIMS
ncbi:MAG TPA: SprT family zinc-dependent metalloprotease [Parafilimonas sp.]|nr:SprT family zinc-dependent metalloprotease [Parafilimonas sp.]